MRICFFMLQSKEHWGRCLVGIARNDRLGWSKGNSCRAFGLGFDLKSDVDAVFRENAQVFGAGGRTRTDMSLTSPDFESGAYTNFATPATREKIISRVVQKSQPPVTTRPRTNVLRHRFIWLNPILHQPGLSAVIAGF